MTATQPTLLQLETPSMPKLDVSRCKARIINYQTASNMVKTYHYAHRVPSIVVAIGMYVDEVLAGCVTFGIPPAPNTQRLCGEKYRKNCLELNRLFVFDWSGHNSESWLIGQAFSILHSQFSKYFILVSYADSKHNHTGYIYQATNWLYTGTSVPGTDIKLNGNKHPRTTQHRGGSALIRQRGGAEVVRSLKHRYVYFLGNRRQRRKLRQVLRWPVLPYPKSNRENK